MVWPPSVRGTLVTEGVRGEGGILTNSENKRFMYDNIPDRFAAETADSEEEANRWLEGDKDARRPPELLTRDVVARAIRKEVKAGRGSPHGGAYLDIASRRNAEDIKRKLPSMYHQFKVLAELDITNERMEVGPTLHYFMGGVKVDANTQMTRVPGLFACGECAAGVHGANRLGGNSLSDLLVCGKLAGSGAVNYIKSINNNHNLNNDAVQKIIRSATDILNREKGENPYLIHEDLQELMQNNVGIVRTDELLSEGLDELSNLWKKFNNVKADGASQFNPGWHQAISLRNLLVTAESVARAAKMREESRGAHTRVDFEGERDEWLQYNIVISKSNEGTMIVDKVMRDEPDPELKRIAQLSIEELENEVLLEKGE